MAGADNKDKLWIVFAVLVIGIVAPLLILGWQSFTFMQTGDWQPFSILSMMDILDVQSTWVASPNSWLGVHIIFDYLHGGLGLMLIALVLIAWVRWFL